MKFQASKRLWMLSATGTALVLAGGLGSLSAAAQTPAQPTVRGVVAHYATLVHANYEDTLLAAQELQKAVRAFTAAPTQARLEAARKAWLDAREYYGQTEAFRFYGGPIDDEEGPEGRINAWPMDESYVDGVEGKPGGGLVNDPKFKISKKTLSDANEKGGEENIATGWHAIEFMLWGQDLNDKGPGERAYTDFVDGKLPNADRRRLYLNVVTDLLIDDLRFLVQAWAPKQKNYRAEFEQGGQESLRKIIVGLGSLSRGELSGERMEVALNTQDQEDEHSCFSDNTHRDIVTNATGIQNVWLGSYKRRSGQAVQGASLRALVAAKDKALADKTTAQIAQSVAHATSIPAPFDQAILDGSPGQPIVKKTIASLVEQSKLLVESASAIGITKLTLVEP
ncbi:iron-regulated protein [Hylemonella gracilis str. Niagara R]|uniref:Iron-regulated protein n=1 Tax=Hylemonella gracilis str. Niagara R TaxID=1458275 RepID=A0A016XF76_9BURK|nr:imelysin family protein [Hylemonella gracilis]EYC50476.1 iron-regulated protein [Hylemonella gracilis str. Niagara R]